MAIPVVAALGNAVGAIGKLSGGITKLNPGLAAVKLGLGAVKAALDRNAKYTDDAVKINERLAITNQTYAEFAKKNAEALEGNTVGFGKSAKILAEANIIGLQGQALERRNLIEAVGRMKITGQNTQALMRLTLDTEKNTLGTRESTELLNRSITAAAAQYGTAAEAITRAVGKLDLTMQTATGAGPLQTQQLVALISAKNQQTGDLAAQALNVISQLDIAGGITAGGAFGREVQAAARQGTLTEGMLRQFTDAVVERLDMFQGVRGAEVETGRAATQLDFRTQALFRSLQQSFGEPEKQRQTFDGIAASLAAAKERASSDSEVRAAMLEGQVAIKEASIIANGFLDSISNYLMPVTSWAQTQLGDMAEAARDKLLPQRALDIQRRMEKKSDELMNINLEMHKNAERTMNAQEGLLSLQEEEVHMRELENARATAVLQQLNSARMFPSADRMLLEQLIDTVAASHRTQEEHRQISERAEAERAFQQAAEME